MKAHAAARVRRRLLDWTKREGHGSHTRLARAVGAKYGEKKSASWASDVLRGGPEDGGADLRLRDLDDVAELLGVPPGELVMRDGDRYLEVSANELKLIRYYRTLPATIQHHMIAYLDFLYAAHERELAEIARERTATTARATRKDIA